MRSTAAFAVLIVSVLYASLTECTILKRQNEADCSDDRYIELFDSIPDECTSALTSLFNGCGRQCSSVICSETCAQRIHDFEVECYDYPGWEVLCSENKNGTVCYDTVIDPLEDVESALDIYCENFTATTCPTLCRAQLERDNNDAGCCLYTYVAVLYDLQIADELWDACSVDTPSLCTSTFTGEPIKVPGSGQVTVTGCISVLVAALLMALTSFN